MPTLAEVKSSSKVVFLDPSVVRDMAAALNGVWQPSDEEDAHRADRLISAARIRLYATRDRTGWFLVTTQAAKDRAAGRDDAEWSVGFLAAIENFDDAPTADDIAGLVRLFRTEDHIDAQAAEALANAILCGHVDMIVTDDPRRYKHSRDIDLPAGLELLSPAEVEEILHIDEGEEPSTRVPQHILDRVGIERWWIP